MEIAQNNINAKCIYRNYLQTGSGHNSNLSNLLFFSNKLIILVYSQVLKKVFINEKYIANSTAL